jgi:hypothetical protein
MGEEKKVCPKINTCKEKVSEYRFRTRCIENPNDCPLNWKRPKQWKKELLACRVMLMTCTPFHFGRGYTMSLSDCIISGLTLLAVGAIIGFLVAYWDSIKKMVRSWIK